MENWVKINCYRCGHDVWVHIEHAKKPCLCVLCQDDDPRGK